MKVINVSVVVNGAHVTAKCSVPVWAGGSGTTLEGSGAEADPGDGKPRRPGVKVFPWRPNMRDYQPRDIVEERAVAALLTSLRSQRR